MRTTHLALPVTFVVLAVSVGCGDAERDAALDGAAGGSTEGATEGSASSSGAGGGFEPGSGSGGSGTVASVLQVAANGGNACMLKNSGQLCCWGDNTFG